MKKKHIAFISFPRTSHINPTLPMVKTLIRRGHRVTYTTSDQFASTVTQLGAEYVSCPPFDVATIARGLGVFCRHATFMLTEIMPFYEIHRPDLIVYDVVALAGRILANKWHIPAVKLSPHPSFSEVTLDVQIRNAAAREWVLHASERADVYLRSYGIRSSGFLFHREALNIHPFPRDFDPNGDAGDESCLYAGRCPAEQPYFGDWRDEAKDDKPIALIVTSTTSVQGPDYFRICVQALSNLQWNIILMPGGGSQLTSLLPLPENFQHVPGTSPAKVLSSAAVLICMGGAMIVSEAMYHGVPLVMTSCGVEELEGLCETWEKLGFGIHVKLTEMNAENLRKAVLNVAENPEILRKVREMRRRVQREPGAEEVANRIEELVERKR